MPTLHFRVVGLVQGVWFRGWTQMTARELGLAGWVMNLPDGSVIGQAQAPHGSGPEDCEAGRAALERFRQELKHGPPTARVDLLDAGYIDLPERFAGFLIRH
ncbi:MAG: acylphosphatase [Proteobacteria bacterium]|nr:acylphosphatase [Pseudomonadota bacterium]MBU1595828.1 acylphosphatase [Pseudomonadota bacterium]